VALLDDLKRQADQARQKKEAEAASLADREKIYSQFLAPRLLDIYRYLTELADYLEETSFNVTTEYDVPGLGLVADFIQGDYKIRVDSHSHPKKVTLQCMRTAAERKYSLSAVRADEFRKFLVLHHLEYSEWPVRDNGGQIVSYSFQSHLRLRAWLSFEADVPNSRIRVLSRAFESLKAREYGFGYVEIDSDWLDNLGHYLLRKKGVLADYEMSQEARERLRQLAERERNEAQVADATADVKNAESSKDSGLFQGLRNRLFKPGKPE
jgi:hypothetical protein